MMQGFQRLPKRSIAFTLLLTVLGLIGWQGWMWWAWAIAPAAIRPMPLKIPQGTSAQAIGNALHEQRLIRSTIAWNIWARWLLLKQPQGGFKAGAYQFSGTESLPAIANKIWIGDVVHSSFTIPEGWSLRQMATYFEQKKLFPARDFIRATEQVSLTDHAWLPAADAEFPRLEGYLYPDTYQVAGESVQPDAIVQQMLERFEQVALPLYQKQQGTISLSFSQWVTLASIVEKEAVVAAERPRIAGVFLNRLKKGMPLGSDPTVEYVLGIQQTPDRPLTFSEVSTPSPYNTYVHPGLPPTPIASPGIASLKAVLNPEKTDYLYFVARYDGTHVFSRTLTEHQTAQSRIHVQRAKAKSAKP